MFTVQREYTFSAAHFLPAHDGRCRTQHGHNFRAILLLEGPSLIEDGPKTGMLIDFEDVDRAMKPLLNGCLDHAQLNQSLGLTHPTSEAVALWIYRRLHPALPLLRAVRVSETNRAWVEYRP